MNATRYSLRAVFWVALGGLISVVLGLLFGGATEPQQFSDPGAVVRWGTPLAKLIMNFSMATAIGALVFAAYASSPGVQQRALQNLAAAAGGLWLGSGILYFLLTFLGATGVPLDFGQEFGEGLWLFATDIELGIALSINLGLAAVVTLLALVVRSQTALIITAALALAALYPLAETGHASGDASHALAVNSMLMHLVGVSVWVGGLVALFSLRGTDPLQNAKLVGRYSTLALIAFGLVGVSGLTASYIRLYKPEDLFSDYGLMLIGKAGLLLVLGAFGALYRNGLIARIQSGRDGGFWRLTASELGIMGLAMGLGTALARTATPISDAPFTPYTPAQLLTGDLLPPELTPMKWLTLWDFDVLWASLALGATVLYLLGVRALNKRGDKWPIGRTISWVSGMAVLFYVTSGAPNAYHEFLFSVHMVGHMILSMLVPVLLVPGAPVTLISRAVPKRTDGSRGLREWVLWAVHTPFASIVSNPIFAALNFALSLVIFYYTPLFRWANEEHLGHQWMLVHFVITGYLFVQALIGVDPMPHRMGYPVKLMLLIGTMAFHAFFGLALLSEKSLLVADWFGSMGRTWGDDPLTDQQAGGAFAWGIGEIPTIVLTLIVVWQWSRSDDRERKRLDRASDRSGNQDLSDYNQMFSKLSKTEDRR